MNLNFGNYKIPDLLKKMYDYQESSVKWDKLGFYIDYDMHYSMTPLDVIPFAATGGDGIHFGFLTDFGKQKMLETCPIVIVSPTNDPPVQLVASNIKEFLSVVCSIKEAEILDNEFDSQEDIDMEMQEWGIEEDSDKRNEIIKLLQNDFDVYPIHSVFEYLTKIRSHRQKSISLNDSYDLGLQFWENNDLNKFDYKQKDTKRIMDFLKSSNLSSRVLFYRNATYEYILADHFDKEIKDVIVASLKNDGFDRESLILKSKY